jgi:hypothetical protein
VHRQRRAMQKERMVIVLVRMITEYILKYAAMQTEYQNRVFAVIARYEAI